MHCFCEAVAHGGIPRITQVFLAAAIRSRRTDRVPVLDRAAVAAEPRKGGQGSPPSRRYEWARWAPTAHCPTAYSSSTFGMPGPTDKEPHPPALADPSTGGGVAAFRPGTSPPARGGWLVAKSLMG